jgi:AraC-like DNA-binding protein
MKAGADLYIEKPFVLEYLLTSVHNMLERRQLMKKAFSTGVANVDIDMFGLPKRDEEFLRKFDEIIIANLSNADLSNDLLARELCISESTLIRKIRKLLNTSTSSYIRIKRLNVAAQMLLDAGGNNVTDICYTVGFSNLSYFSKCFKEHFGCTPSDYISGMPQKS